MRLHASQEQQLRRLFEEHRSVQACNRIIAAELGGAWKPATIARHLKALGLSRSSAGCNVGLQVRAWYSDRHQTGSSYKQALFLSEQEQMQVHVAQCFAPHSGARCRTTVRRSRATVQLCRPSHAVAQTPAPVSQAPVPPSKTSWHQRLASR